ncbi:glycerate kinase [Geodermatophilus aquaeductus]|uniref:Glycerate kinase n=1 Tax=Geodermatophilus aquaeductus TaxID=1564161 RepID=A0A521FHB9_9ACTN|nr:glycerate kinase [Geodermatophilus aquaeductus]SMO95613.1 glycerate kinase [Geodermatophilus aquaeductus]
MLPVVRIVVATDSFKGTLTAAEASDAVARGLLRARPDAEVLTRPVADGGEGTVAAAVRAGARPVTRTVSGPDGRPVRAVFAVDGSTAVVELAAAAGLGLLAGPAPTTATTRGVGELLLAALDAGARRIVLGLGGSASTDAGAGLLQALGVRLLDAAGRDVPPGGAGLAVLDRIDARARDPRLRDVTVEVATDVDNPLTGPDGAAAVYGPQKGATPEQVAALDAALQRFAAVVRRDLGTELEGRPAMGAAGGTAAGVAAVLPCSVASGAELVADLVGLDAALAGTDLAVTGEGSLDAQSLRGKAPAVVAARARAAGVPCVGLAGRVGLDPDALAAAGFTAAHAMTEVAGLARCLAEPAAVLEELAARVLRGQAPSNPRT